MTTIINGSSPSITFSDSTTQATTGLVAGGTIATGTVTTLTTTTISDGTNSTSSTNCIKGAAKVWCNFNGTLSTPITPRSSYNVTDVTKHGTGDYTINFTNAFANTNYATFISLGPTQGTVADCAVITSYTTTGVRISTYYLSGTTKVAADYSTICVSILS